MSCGETDLLERMGPLVTRPEWQPLLWMPRGKETRVSSERSGYRTDGYQIEADLFRLSADIESLEERKREAE